MSADAGPGRTFGAPHKCQLALSAPASLIVLQLQLFNKAVKQAASSCKGRCGATAAPSWASYVLRRD